MAQTPPGRPAGVPTGRKAPGIPLDKMKPIAAPKGGRAAPALPSTDPLPTTKGRRGTSSIAATLPAEAMKRGGRVAR